MLTFFSTLWILTSPKLLGESSGLSVLFSLSIGYFNTHHKIWYVIAGAFDWIRYLSKLHLVSNIINIKTTVTTTGLYPNPNILNIWTTSVQDYSTLAIMNYTPGKIADSIW